jgi:hypothetical protein
MTIRKENYQEEHRKDSTEDYHFRQTSYKERESYYWSLATGKTTIKGSVQELERSCSLVDAYSRKLLTTTKET